MSQKQRIQEILNQAQEIRKFCPTESSEVQNFLNYQQLTITSDSNPLWIFAIFAKPRIKTQPEFEKAFKTLSRLQKAEFYLMNVKAIQKILNREGRISRNSQCLSRSSANLKKIMVSIKDEDQYKKWTKVEIQVLRRQKKLIVMGSKQQISLHDHLLRRSNNKDLVSLALQPKQAGLPPKTIRIGCSHSLFDGQLLLIVELWQEAMQQNLQKILVGNQKELTLNESVSKASSHSAKDEESQIVGKGFQVSNLTNQIRKSIELAEKQSEQQREAQERSLKQSQDKKKSKSQLTPKQIMPDEFVQELDNYRDFREVTDGVFYSLVSKKVRKVFQFSNKQISKQFLVSVIEDVRHIRRRKACVRSVKILSILPAEQTKIYKEINHFKLEDIEFMYFRHSFSQKDCFYMIEKSIQLDTDPTQQTPRMQRASIDYCVWRIRRVGKKMEVFVEAEISYDKRIKNSQEITSEFIGDLKNYVKELVSEQKIDEQALSLITVDFQNDYLSMIQGSSDDQADQVESLYDTISGTMGNIGIPIEFENDIISESFEKSKKTSTQLNIEDQTSHETKKQILGLTTHTKYKYPMEPLQRTQPEYHSYGEGHCLWKNDWKVSEKGELININEEKLKIQNSAFKLIVKKMGRNIFSGKGIMGMSLPIEIFAPQSNLQAVCRSYIYAPILLEKALACKNPIDRMKYCVCFGMSFSIAYINLEKPFNPILGQTYQGLIEGCPIYAEQTSHHPPITSTYLMGRGYRVHASLQGKVQMSMNTASGLNDGFNTICFQNGRGEVKFNSPPFQISGLMYGQCKINLTKKSYFIDEGNRLVCEVAWGRNKKGKQKLGKFEDYFEGTICRMKENFNFQDYKKIKSSHIEEDYGQVFGRYTGKIYFQDQQLLDVNTALPHKMVDLQPCLQSDSRLRRDLQLRRMNDLEGAQAAKEQLEEAQRRDRKLRKQK